MNTEPILPVQGQDESATDFQTRMDAYNADMIEWKKEPLKSPNPPSGVADMITVHGHFEVVKTELGAREIHFIFEHDKKPVSARIGDGGTFLLVETVRKQLKLTPKVECDCYVGTPNGQRTNYQCFDITETSLAFDFGLSNAEIAQQRQTTINSAIDSETAKTSRTDLRAIKAQKRAQFAITK